MITTRVMLTRRAPPVRKETLDENYLDLLDSDLVIVAGGDADHYIVFVGARRS
jgi:hypothetical protein